MMNVKFKIRKWERDGCEVYAPALFVSGSKFYIKDDLTLVNNRETASWYKDKEEVKMKISEYRNTIGADRDGQLSSTAPTARMVMAQDVTNKGFFKLLFMSIRNIFSG